MLGLNHLKFTYMKGQEGKNQSCCWGLSCFTAHGNNSGKKSWRGKGHQGEREVWKKCLFTAERRGHDISRSTSPSGRHTENRSTHHDAAYTLSVEAVTFRKHGHVLFVWLSWHSTNFSISPLIYLQTKHKTSSVGWPLQRAWFRTLCL